MSVEKLQKYAYITICGIGIVLLSFFVFRYLFVLLLPFFIAFIIAYLPRRFAERMAKRLSLSKRFCRVAISLFVLALFLGGSCFLIYAVVGEAWRFVSGLSESGELEDMLSAVIRFPHGMLGNSEIALAWEERIASAISAAAASLVSGVLSSMTAVAAAVPHILLFLLVLFVSVLYMSWDIDRIVAAIRKLLPNRLSKNLTSFKNGILKTALSYLRSYVILMLMTFVLILVGLLILRAEYAALLAVIIALLDILPVIGVGTVLVPWSILSFLMGQSAKGFGLLLLLAAHEIMRQIAEPRILGKSLGVHPLITLILLYAGYSLFGLAGLIFVPCAGVLLGALFNKKDTAEIG